MVTRRGAARQVDRIAFTEGIVVAKCKHCDAKHLVADNLSKLDFGKGKVHQASLIPGNTTTSILFPRLRI
jgi:uncharacterized protein with PIN domain